MTKAKVTAGILSSTAWLALAGAAHAQTATAPTSTAPATSRPNSSTAPLDQSEIIVTANKRVSDLTVLQTKQVQACTALGYYER